MPIINFTKPFSIVIALVLFLLILFLGKETKKPWIPGTMLLVFVALLVAHTIEYATIGQTGEAVRQVIAATATFDLVYIFLSFMTYLWVDDMAVKEGRRKSIDNSLDWFWNKV